uniref:Mucosa-associated lymphoid tissue lymphoma translocation protein 1 n=1 Tax=Pelusios castaneus TaxID=367368 RepID=A0A8C8RSD9_9SAUR
MVSSPVGGTVPSALQPLAPRPDPDPQAERVNIGLVFAMGSSQEELEMCSLKVLEACGSPTQCLLQLLSERDCSLKYLLCCLDKMGHAEAFQFLSSIGTESLRIMVQPESQVVTEGTRASFTCWATGPPGISYQWFCGKQEVRPTEGGTKVSGLKNKCATPDWYICRVNHRASFVFSRWARLQVKQSSSPASGRRDGTIGSQILCQPQPCTLDEGDSLQLQCVAIGNPPPQYQWFRNGSPIEGARNSHLQVPCLGEEEVCGSGKGHWPGRGSVTESLGKIPLAPSQTCSSCSSPGAATDKVALLIGNMNYLHHKHLKAPMVDVYELTNLLRQLDFKVVSLLDLSKDEMQMAVNEFLLLLDKGVYGLLYYAGHGYENFGNSFMVPIDAPGSYTSEHCLCVHSVLQSMQQRQTGLNIFLLDMCRKR